jgi:nicotinate-nucleotide adenylyltransferase
VLQILTWKEQDQVLALAEFIAASRPGSELAALDGLLERLPAAAGRVHRMEIPALAISSTDIRARAARGAPFQYLVPEAVARYIEKRDLYRDATAKAASGCTPPHSSVP